MNTPFNETPASGPSMSPPPRRRSPLRFAGRALWIATLLTGVVGGYTSGFMHLRGHSCGAYRQAYTHHSPCHGGGGQQADADAQTP